MKKVLLLFFIGSTLMSCSSSSDDSTNDENSEGEYVEEEVFTSDNILGTWTVIEFDSESDYASEMMGKTFEFGSDSLTFSYISNTGLQTATCSYELYDEQTIKVTRLREDGKGSSTSKYTGFIEGNKMRLNSSSGSVLLKK